jgi:hypothetical protein
VSAEENKADFRRYVDEVGNEGNLGLVDEIFDIYISHQPDGHTEERGRENVKDSWASSARPSPSFIPPSRIR